MNGTGLKAKRGECKLGREFMSYLGHQIGSCQLALPAHRVQAMKEYCRPKMKRQLRDFLGSVGYYHQFVKNFSKWSSVLTPSTSLLAPRVVSWMLEMERAFRNLRVSLCDYVVLNVPCNF